jgi:hypothetical protein
MRLSKLVSVALLVAIQLATARSAAAIDDDVRRLACKNAQLMCVDVGVKLDAFSAMISRREPSGGSSELSVELGLGTGEASSVPLSYSCFANAASGMSFTELDAIARTATPARKLRWSFRETSNGTVIEDQASVGYLRIAVTLSQHTERLELPATLSMVAVGATQSVHEDHFTIIVPPQMTGCIVHYPIYDPSVGNRLLALGGYGGMNLYDSSGRNRAFKQSAEAGSVHHWMANLSLTEHARGQASTEFDVEVQPPVLPAVR